ncbi:letm1 and EF-hand domain-containing protein 1, mitochondrial [Chytridiales sp. JEL 0842]|nr:letm1 and EF-hand domain-containing protein 1, mitochondrial [Chytridiales sp. JEL 0842]
MIISRCYSEASTPAAKLFQQKLNKNQSAWGATTLKPIIKPLTPPTPPTPSSSPAPATSTTTKRAPPPAFNAITTPSSSAQTTKPPYTGPKVAGIFDKDPLDAYAAKIRSQASALPSSSPVKYSDPLSAAEASIPQSTTLLSKIANAPKNLFVALVAEPAYKYLDGLGLLYERSALSIYHWADYMAKNELVKERNLIRMFERNKRDLFMVLPATVYLALPFTKFTIPTVFSSFPYFVPSCFITAELLDVKRIALQRKRVATSQALLKFFEKRIESIQSNSAATSTQLSLLKKILSSPVPPTYSDLASLYPLFHSHFPSYVLPSRFRSLASSQLGLTIPSFFGTARLLRAFDWIVKDDEMLRREGVSALTDFEVVEALIERGYTNLTGDSLAVDPRQSLIAHIKFTQLLVDVAKGNRDPSRDPVMNGAVLHGDELGAVGSLLVFARALGVERFN